MAVKPTHDLFTPAALDDPYPIYAAVRDAAPVSCDRLLPGWALTGYDEVAQALRDPRLSARRSTLDELQRLGAGWGIEEQGLRAYVDFRARWMLFSDPPDHTRLRGLVTRAFTPRVVERMRDSIQQLVDQLVDAAEPRGEMDVIRDFAYPLPATVICVLLGLPAEDRERFKAWSDDVASTLVPLASPDIADRIRRCLLAQGEVSIYLRELIARRRRAPTDDLLSALITAEERGDVLSTDELLSTCVLLLIAGHETTTNLIGNGLLALLRHPDQLERLRAQPALIGPAIEELLRYDSPVQLTVRRLVEDFEVGGTRIPAGRLVTLVIGAANRDPRQFAEPDRLDVMRRDVRHLSFAHGSHYCVGAPLARVEAELAFRTLLARLPRLRLRSDAPPVWGPHSTLRGLASLPVAF